MKPKKRLKASGALLALFAILSIIMPLPVNAEAMKWYTDLNQALAQARKAKKWVFVDVGAEW
ncbi:MAG TPA: thioredoxin family protein [Candidatus Melainabacteria bacterium]|nr:thioredoxin family protein [Candidatus Melainabacteria bacterium]